METLEALKKTIGTTEDLRSVVRTMKSLSVVSIRQYERAVVALREYSRTIELGLQAIVKRERSYFGKPGERAGRTVAVVFGSDYGLCGRFNHEIVQFTLNELQRRKIPDEDVIYLVAGARAGAHLDADHMRVQETFPLPGSVEGLTDTAHDLLLKIVEEREKQDIGQVFLFHNHRSEAATVSPRLLQLLPLSSDWLEELATRKWPYRSIPTFTMDAGQLFSAIVRQHIFIGLFRAGAESAASEHAARLAAMQTAEHNIEQHLEEMYALFRRRRQELITEELHDVVAGFEVLAGSEEDRL